ncbi:hypothetical protein DFP98_110157 [Cohnella phaseoli]|uniref:Uncharacterized protein n=1 Tax=Cohnella phaseoli TaxID=456490 RepID=A0A3D9JSB2_9BACL|nr:hypothetical protein DFP98_110157 [Cohnella phaseoli]
MLSLYRIEVLMKKLPARSGSFFIILQALNQANFR